MGESAIAQSAPPAAGALSGLLAVQVRRAVISPPCLAPVHRAVRASLTDQQHEHA